MTWIRRSLTPACTMAILFASHLALAAQAPAATQQDGFIPIDQLPPTEQLPAAPLLITAYAFVWVALFAYVLSVARRLTKVQQEVERLEADVRRSGRG